MMTIIRKSTLTTISIFTIAIVVVIAGFFLLEIEKAALNLWAFGSLLFSLVVSLVTMLTLVAPKRNKDNVSFTSGLSGAVWVYEIAVIISILFTKSFVEYLGRFILLQIAINALFFIITIVIMNVSGHIHDSNAKTHENLQNGEYDKPKRGGF